MTREELLVAFGESNPIKCLDHGHVFLVDVMGSDERIEQVARLSYEGNRKKSDTRNLLRYLMRHRHTSPFEQAVITLDIKLPIFVARQLVRHRTQSLNEVSGRYSVLPEEYYIPTLDQICNQSLQNKQGRAERHSIAAIIQNQQRIDASDAFTSYAFQIEQDVARETARMQLPLSTYTHWVTTWDLHNLFHMLSLRLDSHAQWEIRVFAEAIWTIVQEWVPISAEAFIDYRLDAHTFSGPEMELLTELLARVSERDTQERAWMQTHLTDVRLSSREQKEFLAILNLED